MFDCIGLTQEMKAAKELIKVQKKIKKAQRKCTELVKQEKELHVKICEKEKENASKDRARYLHNIQATKVGPLLKRKLVVEEPDLDYNAEIRDYVFGIQDIFLQITTQLGPMEYFVFSRTSKHILASLTSSFSIWAFRFMDRLKEETPMRFGFLSEQEQISPLLLKFLASLKFPNDPQSFSPLHLCLSRLQMAFVKCRPYGTLYFMECENKGRIYVDKWTRQDGLCYLYNKRTGEITRPTDHNVLFSTRMFDHIAWAPNHRLAEKYGFFVPKQEVDTSYFNYDDLNNLALHTASSIKKRNAFRFPFFIDLEAEEGSAQIVSYASSPYTIYFLANERGGRKDSESKSSFLYDEYETRFIVQSFARNNPRFSPVYHTERFRDFLDK